MKIGDLVRMKYLNYGCGIIQKTVFTTKWDVSRNVYHILWPDGDISNQYENEIVLVSRVK